MTNEGKQEISLGSLSTLKSKAQSALTLVSHVLDVVEELEGDLPGIPASFQTDVAELDSIVKEIDTLLSEI